LQQQTELRKHIQALLRRNGLHYKAQTQNKTHWTKHHYCWLERTLDELSGSLRVNLELLGTVNFLFDKSQNPHLRGEDLARLCGVAPSTAANQGRKVRDLLGMYQGDPNWCLPSFMDANPLV